ncbi:MAG: dipeptide ABC transporter ATP-binding protein, partial [Anaerolineales bacterium]
SWVKVIEGLSLKVYPGETFGLVGESGCGKSTTANAIMGYRPRGARYSSGSVCFEDKDLLQLDDSKLQKLRGAKISLVPQNPTTALSPGMRVGPQIAETLLTHHFSRNKAEAKERAIDLLRQVSLPSADKTFNKYPHQLSGGQQQRVIIAMALACDPKLIVLDEPTTGLDVTTQAQILDLLLELRSRYSVAMFYITHNLGVVAQVCDRIGVMYAGRLVEVAPTKELFASPQHPYTHGLIASVPRVADSSRKPALLLKGLLRRSDLPGGCQFAPRCDYAQPRCFEEFQPLLEARENHQIACWRWRDIPPFDNRLQSHEPLQQERHSVTVDTEAGAVLLEVESLVVGYGSNGAGRIFQKPPTIIVDGISFNIYPGETLALVGESGSGKTTVARALSGLAPYVTGNLKYEDQYDLSSAVSKRPDDLLRSVQLIFQNPDASLNPRQRVSKITSQPLKRFYNLSGGALRQRVESLLEDVRLDRSYYNRYPDELSGGERQRIAIARALAAEPELLLCDEVLSALDVSVQASILELLIELQSKRNVAYLFISHDLAVVRSIANRVGVLYWGALCELGDADEVFNHPSHPYTEVLIKAIPEPDPEYTMPRTRKDTGLLVDEEKKACPFAPRCPRKIGSICDEQEPPWRIASQTHRIRCHIPLEELQVIRGETIHQNQQDFTIGTRK